jgi:hypothetical protein
MIKITGKLIDWLADATQEQLDARFSQKEQDEILAELQRMVAERELEGVD